jgi:hypothetical protein
MTKGKPSSAREAGRGKQKSKLERVCKGKPERAKVNQNPSRSTKTCRGQLKPVIDTQGGIQFEDAAQVVKWRAAAAAQLSSSSSPAPLSPAQDFFVISYPRAELVGLVQ